MITIINASGRKWWKEAIIYQVYPRSFKDSDGDGIGDLKGILSKIDYIVSLGIDTVWINPVYASAGTDNGYDISDYEALQPEYGDMEDMERLIGQLHEKKIRVIMDMVVNHTSDEHDWFRQARSGRDNPYYTFYHWWPAEKGRPPYRCGFFDPAGEGWAYNAATDSYYLHYFSARQPDLNWENPELRRQIHQVLKFWLDKGIDGFRMDAIPFISKDTAFPLISPDTLQKKYRGDWGHYYASGPHLHQYLREMQEEVLEKYGAVAIAEGPGVLPEQAPDFVDEERKELDMLCHFEGIMIGYLPGEFKKMDPAGYRLSDWKKIYTRWDKALAEKGWGTLYLGNHDQPRMVSHWGDDSQAFRDASAKMLFTFLLTMRATPFIYNGDEIGMTNIRFKKIEDYEDIETLHIYQKIRDQGGDTAAFLKDQQLAGRDNGRTPFQWNTGDNAGFTTGTPWLKINENYRFINAEIAEKDPGSILYYVRKLIRLRKEQETMVYGDYNLVNPDDPDTYAYTRTLDSEGFLVVLNFSKEERVFSHFFHLLEKNEMVLSNYPAVKSEEGRLWLLPYQAVIYTIRIGQE